MTSWAHGAGCATASFMFKLRKCPRGPNLTPERSTILRFLPDWMRMDMTGGSAVNTNHKLKPHRAWAGSADRPKPVETKGKCRPASMYKPAHYLLISGDTVYFPVSVFTGAIIINGNGITCG